MHGSTGVLTVASDAHAASGGVLIPTISCRSTVSDTEYENVSAKVAHVMPSVLENRMLLVPS